MKSALSIVLIATLFLPGGCKKRSKHGVRWPSDPKLQIKQWETKVLDSSARVSYHFPSASDKDVPLMLKLYFFGFPKGTKLAVNAQTETLDGNSWFPKIDVAQQLGAIELRLAKSQKIDLGLQVSIEAPKSKKLAFKIPPQRVAGAIVHALHRARDGGVRFGKEPALTGKPKSIAVLSYSSFDVVGQARLVRDIDWVVFHEKQASPRTTRTCQFKKHGGIPVDYFAASAYLVDRRTGKQIATTTLQPSMDCPMFTFIRGGRATSTVGITEVTRWAREMLAKHGG